MSQVLSQQVFRRLVRLLAPGALILSAALALLVAGPFSPMTLRSGGAIAYAVIAGGLGIAWQFRAAARPGLKRGR
jgi:hypothetical protein